MHARVMASLLVVTALSATALATPLEVRHGRVIRVAIAGKSEEATALRSTPEGWRVDLPRGATGTLVVRDVTLGAAPQKFELPVAAGASVLLDSARFRPDHAYRAELRRATVVVGSVLLYLSPPPRNRGPVVFDDRDAAQPGSSDGELTTSDKGTL